MSVVTQQLSSQTYFIALRTKHCDRRSFVVDAEDDASAEERGVLIRVGSIVIVGLVPEAFRCDAHTLTKDLSNHALHDDLVTGDVQLLGLVLDVNDNSLGPILVLLMVELDTVQLSLDALLNDLSDLGGIESLMLPWLHPVSGHMRHARVSKIEGHFL